MESREIKRAKMFALIEEFRSGDETQVEFCNRSGLNLFTFRYWLNRYESKSVEKPESGFVRVTGLEMTSLDEIELRYPNGVRIGLGRRADSELLAQLIRLW